MDSLFEAARRPLLELGPVELAGSLVLLDAGAAEVAALSLGPAFLFGGESGSCVVYVCVSGVVGAPEEGAPRNAVARRLCSRIQPPSTRNSARPGRRQRLRAGADAAGRRAARHHDGGGLAAAGRPAAAAARGHPAHAAADGLAPAGHAGAHGRGRHLGSSGGGG
jgi:hypothetical protein